MCVLCVYCLMIDNKYFRTILSLNTQHVISNDKTIIMIDSFSIQSAISIKWKVTFLVCNAVILKIISCSRTLVDVLYCILMNIYVLYKNIA